MSAGSPTGNFQLAAFPPRSTKVAGGMGAALANYLPGSSKIGPVIPSLKGEMLDRFAFRVSVALGPSELYTSPEVPAFALALRARGFSV